MEYSLTSISRNPLMGYIKCLNPYSNGILSDLLDIVGHSVLSGLNPYSNGILSDERMGDADIQRIKS